MSTTRRLILILSAVVAFGALAIDMYLSALPQMAIDLSASAGQMQLTLSLFFMGFCVGMLIYGPLSDYFGRRKLLLSGIGLFALTSALCTFANNVHILMLLRITQALGCGACVVMARAAVRDLFPPSELPQMMSKISLVTMAAPLLAPSIGALCLYHLGWRSIFVVLALFASCAGYMVYQYVPETHMPDKSHGLHLGGVLHQYYSLLGDQYNLRLMIGMAAAMSGMFAFISGSPFVYTQLLNYTEFQFALLFGSNIVGMLLVTTLNLHLLKHFEAISLMRYQAIVLVIAGLCLLIVSITRHLTWIIPLVIIYVAHINALCANGMAILLRRYQPQQAGSLTALATSLQFGTAAISTSLVAIFSHNPALAMTSVMALFALIAIICIHKTHRDTIHT